MASDPVVHGLVLAGGASRRMGRDKAALRLDGQTLLERAVALLAASLDQVFVSVNPNQSEDTLRRRYNLIVDSYADAGPAAGLLAAHDYDPAAAWLVVGCDMPGLRPMHVTELLRQRDPAAVATVWQSAGDDGLEPLCALYEPATLAAFTTHVRGGGRASPRDWLERRKVKRLVAASADELRSANTPAEFESVVAGLSGPKQQAEN